MYALVVFAGNFNGFDFCYDNLNCSFMVRILIILLSCKNICFWKTSWNCFLLPQSKFCCFELTMQQFAFQKHVILLFFFFLLSFNSKDTQLSFYSFYFYLVHGFRNITLFSFRFLSLFFCGNRWKSFPFLFLGNASGFGMFCFTPFIVQKTNNCSRGQKKYVYIYKMHINEFIIFSIHICAMNSFLFNNSIKYLCIIFCI